MILLTALNQSMVTFLATGFVMLALGLLLKRYKQPYIVAYLVAGILLGPYVLGIFNDMEAVKEIGDLGLIILMFFIGMEIHLPEFLKKWKVALLGTGLQVAFSIALVVVLGLFLNWPWPRMLLVGFIISLSSSAVVIKLLDTYNETKTLTGQNVISVLLTQDILIVPMMILVGISSGESIDKGKVVLQLIGGASILLLLLYIIKKKNLKLPFANKLRGDYELQVFAGLLICFGLSLFTSVFELSAALGAFVGGMLVHAAHETEWLRESLHPFRVILVAGFFLSVGLLIDLNFLSKNWIVISLLVLLIYLSNHGINSLALRLLGNSWRESFYGGALLAQIGELSFVLVTLGHSAQIISDYTFQVTVIVISITILLSPMYISLSRKLSVKMKANQEDKRLPES